MSDSATHLPLARRASDPRRLECVLSGQVTLAELWRLDGFCLDAYGATFAEVAELLPELPRFIPSDMGCATRYALMVERRDRL